MSGDEYMGSFFEILLGTIFSVAIIYSFFYVYYRLIDVGKIKAAKTLRFTVLILYIAFVIWFPNIAYKVWFSMLGGFVCLVFSDDGFKNNKLASAIVLTAVYGILWMNASQCVWDVLYPPHYTQTQQTQEKINIPAISKQQKKEPSSDTKKNYSEAKGNSPSYDYKPIDFDTDDFTDDELFNNDDTLDDTSIDDIDNDSDTDIDIEESIRESYRRNQSNNSNPPAYNNYAGSSGYSTNSTGDVYVDPYIRSDGTVVQGHYRSRPNSTTLDNYSHKGNINPYTGKRGYNNY